MFPAKLFFLKEFVEATDTFWYQSYVESFNKTEVLNL